MPISLSIRPLSTRLAVRPRAMGGYERVSLEDPNDPLATFQRNQRAASTASRGHRGSLLPTITASEPTRGKQVYGGRNLDLDEQATAGIGVTGPDSLGLGLMQRGMASRAVADLVDARSPASESLEEATDLVNNPGSTFVSTRFDPNAQLRTVTRGGYLPDPQWEGLKQALFEAGVGRIRTGARAGWDAPGFFDTQTPRMSRAMNTMSPRERLLLQEMAHQQKSSPYGR